LFNQKIVYFFGERQFHGDSCCDEPRSALSKPYFAKTTPPEPFNKKITAELLTNARHSFLGSIIMRTTRIGKHQGSERGF